MTPRLDFSPGSKARDFLRGLAVAVGAGVFLALGGAFGSNGAPLAQRLAYWVPVLVVGGLWGHLCSLLVERFIDVDARPWLGVAALTLVITGPLTLMVWALTGSRGGCATPTTWPTSSRPWP